MHRRCFLSVMAIGALSRPTSSTSAPFFDPVETPSLAGKVKAGILPPVGRRLPISPSIVKEFAGSDGIGRCGGDCNMLVAAARDTRLMTIYANSRLIVYDWHFKLQPDILESYRDEDGRTFTLKLRAGHKWSDGQPFTTEDFRYYWQDVANNRELSPQGPPVVLLVEGRPPEVEILDELTIRYVWHLPNPYFIGTQAQAAPLWLFRPAHYLKRFHERYASATEIARNAEGGEQNWVEIHRRVDSMYFDNNPELPTLNPWMLTTKPPAQRFVFERNPFYHRVDEKGQQLPYFDRVLFTQVAAELVPAKAGLGEADLQCRYLSLRDYTFLRRSSRNSGINVRLWQEGSGSQLAFYPNLNAKDDVWRKLNRDVRFRRALSLSIDRSEINQVVFLGLAKPSNNTIMPLSELFKPAYTTLWATYDAVRASQLLDQLGLDKRDNDGIRLLPDGRSATIVVEHTSNSTEDVDTLSLVSDQWKKIGIKLLTKQQSVANFRARVTSGDAFMTAYAGVVTAVPTVETPPKEFAPTMLGGLQWPRWGLYVESGGTQGEQCDLPEACQLLSLVRDWETAGNDADRRDVWEHILEINAQQVFSIGTVNGVGHPIVVGAKVRNVPETGYYAWDPGGYIGLYKPDTFWRAD